MASKLLYSTGVLAIGKTMMILTLVAGTTSAPPARPRAARVRAAKQAPAISTEGSSCRKLPPGKRIVKLNLKPDTDLADLIAWISAVTCKQFVLPGNLPASRRKVTIFAPGLLTPGEAYRLFLEALDANGLTVYPEGKFLRVVEIHRAKTSPIPTYSFAGRRL